MGLPQKLPKPNTPSNITSSIMWMIPLTYADWILLIFKEIDRFRFEKRERQCRTQIWIMYHMNDFHVQICLRLMFNFLKNWNTIIFIIGHLLFWDLFPVSYPMGFEFRLNIQYKPYEKLFQWYLLKHGLTLQRWS